MNEEKEKFESSNLMDIGLLSAHGFAFKPLGLRGHLVFFEVECSPAEAERLLHSPDHRLIMQYVAGYRRAQKIVHAFAGRA